VAEIIKLTCPTCGGKLEVTGDIERFACSYCGNEHMVIRRGGIVSLKPVVEALEKVEAGTDRTASELAMARLEKEIYFLRQDMAKRDLGTDVIGSGSILFGCIGAFLVGTALLAMLFWLLAPEALNIGDVLCWVVPAIIAGAIALRLWRRAQRPDKAWSARQQRLKAQLDAKIAEYQKHRRIVEGNG